MYPSVFEQRSARILTLVALVYMVIVIFSSCTNQYELIRDIESVAHRAQVAADADDMLVYMQDLKSNMELHNVTSGYSTPFFKTPANDLSLLYESINRIIERLEQIKGLPKSDTAYQVGLDDLRGTIRELEPPSIGVVFTQYWAIWLFGLALWVWPVVYFFRYKIFN